MLRAEAMPPKAAGRGARREAHGGVPGGRPPGL